MSGPTPVARWRIRRDRFDSPWALGWRWARPWIVELPLCDDPYTLDELFRYRGFIDHARRFGGENGVSLRELTRFPSFEAARLAFATYEAAAA